jgi:hypothetical protein
VANEKRKVVCVPVLPALISLKEKDSLAAKWFIDNLPPSVNVFTFGADEVEALN